MTGWVTRIVIAGSIAFTLGAPLSGLGETPFSSVITGTVRDATQGTVAGATVTISAPTLIGGTQAVAAAVDGTYRFALLPSGVYDVSASSSGLQQFRRTDVRVASGETVTIDFTLGVAGVNQDVEVRGGVPAVDVKNPGVPVRLDEDLLQNLPTVRAVDALINLAPGIASDVAFGGSQKGNEILLDGARTTDPLYQDTAVRANYNWIKEVNIVALGAAAEYGGFTGAAAHAILRSGSNRFSGLGEVWTIRPGWLDSNTDTLTAGLQRQFLSREVIEWRDTSAQLGGPIVQNRVWFFAGVQHARHTDRPAGFSGPGSRDEQDLQLIAKPTAAISPAVRLDGFVEHGRRRVVGEWLSPAVPLEASSDAWNPQTSWNTHLTWTLNPRTVVEARHAGYDARFWTDPHAPATIDGPAARFDVITASWSQNTNYVVRSDNRVHTTATSLMHYVEGFAGLRHELKVGAEYEATEGRQEDRFPGNRNYYDLGDGSVQVEIWGGQARHATTARYVLHVQDQWSASDRLTLSPGVRLEWNRGSAPARPDVFRTSTIAPRFGIAWDLSGNHRTVARLHFGRYYDTIFSNRIMQADRTGLTERISALMVGPGPDDYAVLNRFTVIDNFAIDSDLEHSYVSQLVVGVERELWTDFSLQGQYIRRRFDTFMGLIDTGSIYTPVQLRDPGADGVRDTSDDGALLDVFNLANPGHSFNYYTNPDNAFNKYDAAQIVGRKRYSRDWQLQLSYTWSRNRGTVGNKWHVNAAHYDLGNRFVNPNFLINAYGRATFDPTHEAKVLGSYRVPFWGGAMVSGVYRYTTGQAWGRTAFMTGFVQGQQRIRIEPPGTRRAPAINRLDLRVEKTATLPRINARLGLFVDIFNLTNQGVPNSDITIAINEVSGARFGEPLAWVDPRMLRVGIRVTF